MEAKKKAMSLKLGKVLAKQLGNIINNRFDVTAASESRPCAVSTVLSFVAKLFQFFPAAGDRDVVTGLKV